jgi:exopolysaccharide biosynthesis predicted pyruvyltransferase EpsI
LFKNFPNANVTLEKLVIMPFEGDTLISLGELNLKCQLKSFKGKEEAAIDGIKKNGLINIIFNKNGVEIMILFEG